MVQKIENINEKADITNSVLRALPDWIRIETAIVENVKNMPFWAVFEKDKKVEVTPVKQSFA